MGRLDGKVAVVTGGARGIGMAEARLLAAEGAAVVVNDRGGDWAGAGRDDRPAQQVVDLIAAAGGTATANYEDVATWDGGRRLIDHAIEAFGRLDVVVCNAGIMRDNAIFDMEEAEWDEVIRVNLKGHFVPTRFASQHWREQTERTGAPSGGRLILTSSEAGLYGTGGQANYASAKAGVAALGILAARKLGRFGVTVNTICPRARTRMTEAALGSAVFSVTDGAFDLWDPDNVAPMIAFLASDDAAHITGQMFRVGGGTVELLEGWHPVGRIDRDGRWTTSELAALHGELFGDRVTTTLPPPST